ncbi:uncharacterized protein HMPREF1541_07459 [Cyphellophora europaea CBS 101466]|uniref:Uncharacterized protein n=1 Tax=Cyphellophora europaea (strain CBS 101466) TaxID=1220924 RepID=W2RMV5_CYPE1|nr:uncharacterized protein HMPREF1541_07459 [Cyphellophora europaea CBS 101466]ETN37836.1 hypothetical protein HMPREF1541_07459 [Cyphellophora europaea CBS 101466]
MPPTRTIPPAKAVKTERTHEENQERSYIAASRRSDRSLEARVESARRASEIHKRRTGRSLRVTEQDVINEEMYEEEDDDLPLQYRRLTAHLQTGSADFNRRLAAYLTNQVAMRSAMEQMVNNPYPSQYGNPQYPQTPQNMFQSPMLNHNMAQSPAQSYRATPYPSPHQSNFRQLHSRAYSMAGPTPAVSNPRQSLEQRRLSTPSVPQAGVPTPISTDRGEADSDYMRQTQSAAATHGQFPPLWQDMGPFTTQLPRESQQMLGPVLDANDPFQAQLMGGSEDFTNVSGYPWSDMSQGIKGMPVHPSAWPGMSATLAPSALDSTPTSAGSTPSTVAPTANDSTAPSSGLDFNFSQESKGLNMQKLDGNSDALDSDQATPGDGFWDNFVNDASWADDSITTA